MAGTLVPKGWSRVLVEMLVVGVGVFLALFADAALDDWQSRRSEARYLANLLPEMRAAREELRVDDDARQVLLALLDSLQTQFDERVAADSEVERWINASTGISAFFPPSAVMEDYLSSGNLQLLASEQLRFSIISYSQERAMLRFVEENERSFVAEQLHPFLLERMSFTGGANASALDSLLASRTFENFIARRRNQVTFVLSWSERLAASLDRALELLERRGGPAS